MGLSVENLIRTVPEERLEEEEHRQLKEWIVAEYHDYVGRTEKQDTSARQNHFFIAVLELLGEEERCSWESEESQHDRPELEEDIATEDEVSEEEADHQKHAGEEDRVFLIRAIDPEPEPEEEEETEIRNHVRVFVWEEQRPVEIKETRPWKC